MQCSLYATNPDPHEIYQHRREELRKTLRTASPFCSAARRTIRATCAPASSRNRISTTSPAGWSPARSCCSSPGEPREILFVPRRDPDEEIWTGRKYGPDDADIGAVTGFDTVMPAESVRSRVPQAPGDHARSCMASPTVRRRTSSRPWPRCAMISDAATEIAKLRMEKSPEEMALLQRAVDATLAAHRAAWKRAAPGLYEYQVAATMEAVYLDQGCERSAYAPIVGSGPNATVLHYSRNSRRMDRGELLLMDVGAECAGYAADITRTIPVGATFTPRQREIYDIVLGAQNAVIAAVKPGMTIGKTTPNSLYTDRLRLHQHARQGSQRRAAGQVFHARHQPSHRPRSARCLRQQHAAERGHGDFGRAGHLHSRGEDRRSHRRYGAGHEGRRAGC